MDQVVSEHKGNDLHVILDNFSTHKGEEVGNWLKKHPNVKFHHTPVGSSWMNQYRDLVRNPDEAGSPPGIIRLRPSSHACSQGLYQHVE